MGVADHPVPSAAERVRVRVTGAVQGVGMRPFVWRLAHECGLTGFVANGADGVTIEVEGEGVAAFLARLGVEAPPLARIDALSVEVVPPTGATGFIIEESRSGRVATRIVPDAATCPACRAELFDRSSRFFGYPFINCTHCGPRYTITRALPYDRAQTSMAGFPMCEACAAAYADPADRRFHAEPVACAVCGPRLAVVAIDHLDGADAQHPSPQGKVARSAGRGRASGDPTTDEPSSPVSVKGKPAETVLVRVGGPSTAVRREPDVVTRTPDSRGWSACADQAVDGARNLSNSIPAGGTISFVDRRDPFRPASGRPPSPEGKDDPVALVADALRAGRIVALKGIGGFHLLVDARNEAAVAELRRRKARDAKPFAVMVANAASLGSIADPTPAETALAASAAAPIVLMAERPGALAPSVNPGLARVGVMLAYAPVHHLLFAALGGTADPDAPNPAVLVATSANPGGEPLVIDDADARRRLGGIADLVVGHDRPIVIRADDSVLQVVAGAPAYLRRARGFVPDPIPLAEDGPDVLALGAHLKATVCVTRGREAFVSQHVGDLDMAETVRFHRETTAHLLSILDVRPVAVACDLHPDYRSSRLAEEMGLPVVRVQHHASHVAAAAAEHGITGPVLGLALDGHGLGDDGGAWGGELLLLDGPDHRRLGHLAPLPLPGGDRAAREPWRMAVAALHATGRGETAATRFPDRPLAGPLARRLAGGAEPLATSSLGRLFDAAAGLLGLRPVQDHEGQAAMELEALVRAPRALAGGWTLDAGVLSFAPLLAHLADAHPDPAEGADLLHGTLDEGLAALARVGARDTGLRQLVLGGGCLMNRVLAEGLIAALAAEDLDVSIPRKLPPNDGGLSLGQAAIARARLRN